MIPTPILLFYLVGLEVRFVDIGFIDMVLKFDAFALVFIIFAFVGIANSFNIIDGFNALLLGYCFTYLLLFIFLEMLQEVYISTCILFYLLYWVFLL